MVHDVPVNQINLTRRVQSEEPPRSRRASREVRRFWPAQVLFGRAPVAGRGGFAVSRANLPRHFDDGVTRARGEFGGGDPVPPFEKPIEAPNRPVAELSALPEGKPKEAAHAGRARRAPAGRH